VAAAESTVGLTPSMKSSYSSRKRQSSKKRPSPCCAPAGTSPATSLRRNRSSTFRTIALVDSRTFDGAVWVRTCSLCRCWVVVRGRSRRARRTAAVLARASALFV